MKKLLVAAAMAALLLSTASAYNPPVGAEDMCLLSSPRALSGGLSVTGGAIFAAGAESIVVNPALTASSQRTNLNFGYTLLATGNDVDDHTVTVYFKRIREKLGTNIIITVKGIGYRIDDEK